MALINTDGGSEASKDGGYVIIIRQQWLIENCVVG